MLSYNPGHPMFTSLLRFVLAAAALALTAAAGAQTAPAAPFTEDTLKGFVSQHAASAGGDAVTRFEVKLGQLDPNTTLAPCRRIEPFLPANARLWGRSSVGVRCAEGANWSILLPVTVSFWGRAWVAANPLAAGSVVNADDVREEEVELTRERPGLARDMNALIGKTLNRNVSAGQVVRPDMLRVTSVVAAGDPVRIRMLGKGFSIAGAGQALNAAGEGQMVKVRTEMGRIVSGVARDGRVVDVTL
jgi:flagella basal body P-ring formation protein FlgA